MGRGRGSRVTLGLLPVLAVLLALAGVWVGIAEQQGGSVLPSSEADKVGEAYLAEVDAYRTQVVAGLIQHRGAPARELRNLLDQAIPQFPKLPPTPPEDADESEPYQAAVRASTASLKPLTSLRAQLDTAAQAEVFVAGADDALDRAAVTLIGSSLVFDTAPLTTRTLPELRDALADARSLPVPPKAQPAAQAVNGVIARAIREIETMIDKIEAGESHSFDLSDQFAAAEKQVKDYAIDMDGDVREAVARLRDSA